MDDDQGHTSLLKRLLYFFPVQLLLLQFKRNHLVLFFWTLIFAFSNGWIGKKFGIQNLFLTPEYLGEISPISFGLLGFACGGFIMAFHIYSYSMYANRFSFICSLSRPFFKFCLNNSLIPTIFVLNLFYLSAEFQSKSELLSDKEIALNLVSYLLGNVLFIALSILYFIRINRKRPKTIEGANTFKNNKEKKWYEAFFQDSEWHVRSYISSFISIRLARDVDHYDDEMRERILSKHRLNATLMEVFMIASLVILGTFKENEVIRIPAAASIFLLLTIALMLINMFYTWLKGWTTTVIILVIVLINYLTGMGDYFRYTNHAYGLDYTGRLANYSNAYLDALNSYKLDDVRHEINALERWRLNTNEERPKLVIIACSGGGLRSTTWTYQVLQALDAESNGDFFKHSRLITGSSGGMIGAAYYRELYHQDIIDSSYERFSRQNSEALSKDLLNSVSFTIATSDLFPRLQSFEYEGLTYTKDRAFMFEQNLNQNTNGVLDKGLGEYYLPVANGQLPMMILAPSIVNDGRRLLISSQPICYLTDNSLETDVYENVEFSRLFKHQGANNLRFTSALRMNATFPYVFPMVTLPSEPSIEVMDAGIRDNYGIKDAVAYVHTFENWIKQNTSGVILVQIRDRAKASQEEYNPSGSLLKRVFKPFSNLYGNVFKTQDYTNEQLLKTYQNACSVPFDIYSFDLINSDDEDISMSWHLTQSEKKKILATISNKKNMSTLYDIIKKIRASSE